MMKRQSCPLAPGYTAETNVTELEWYEQLREFEDANIYQTWSYAKVMWGLDNTSHLLLKKDGSVVAAAQVRVAQIPMLNVGIAYVFRGPMWRKDGAQDPETLGQVLRALRNEYVSKRGLFLRLAPWMFANEPAYTLQMFGRENYELGANNISKMTILMDLSPSIDELRAGLHRNWKRNLKAAESRGLEVVYGDGEDLFKEVITMYREMVSRKAFLEPNDIDKFRRVQGATPADLKMKVALCRSTEGICAGLVWSEIGETAIELFAATTGKALTNGAAYLLRWELVEHLKRSGVRMYNLNGINQVKNPGVYHFKSGLAGKAGTEIAYLGLFEARSHAVNNYCVQLGQQILESYRTIRTRIRARKKKSSSRHEMQRVAVS